MKGRAVPFPCQGRFNVFEPYQYAYDQCELCEAEFKCYRCYSQTKVYDLETELARVDPNAFPTV